MYLRQFRLLSLCLLATAANAAPTAQVTLTTRPPVIDGMLDDAGWSTAKVYGDFTRAESDQPEHTPAPVQTRFRVLRDDEAVYVGVECDEPLADQIKAQTPWRDGAVWGDDCVEIFFDPAGEGRYFHQLMVNPRGTIYDCHNADYGLVSSKLWNGAFTAAGKVDLEAKRWTAEVKIPFGALVLGDNAQSTWLWNVTRERKPAGGNQLSTWSPLKGNFHQPRLFGKLTGLPSNYQAFRLSLGEPQVGVSRASSGRFTLTMSLPVENQTGAALRLQPTASALLKPDSVVQADPVSLAVGGSTTIAFPPLQLSGSAPQTNIVFTLIDADGKVLKAACKSLASEYKPLSITIFQPCYRNTIYATQKLTTVEFGVALSAQVQQQAKQIRYQLLDESNRVLQRGGARPDQLAQPLRLSANDIPLGHYRLVVEVTDGEDVIAQAETPLHRVGPPPAGHEVRIDEHRNLLVDGEPILPIGWYGGIPDDPRPEVMALQDIVTPAVINPPDKGNIREAYEQDGTYTVASVENGRLFYSFNLWRGDKKDQAVIRDELHTLTAPSELMKEFATKLVDTVRGEPGLLGYYIADEPEIHDVPSSYLENYYQFLCELDPYHPVFVTNDTIDGIVTHGYKCADVIDPDPYSPQWGYVPNFLNKVNEVASRGKATYVTLWHSTGETHFNRDLGSSPAYPYQVFRNQYLVSVALGAKGWTAYTSAFYLPEIEYRYGLPFVWRELRFLQPAIVAPAPAEPPVAEPAQGLAVWAREVKGKVYLLAVNYGTDARDATLRWPGLGSRTILPVVSEDRQVEVKQGAFRDHFAVGEAHVYTDDPAGLKLATTKQVEAELAQRKAAAIQPGNLFHLSRGVRARCSDGYYAPWFEQYYYYALNGIDDDLGWFANRWRKEPVWFELTLPKPSELGRVVITSPNLSDFTLEAIAPDGSAQKAEVTGNQADPVTVNFAHPVPCLKLRLTVTKIREEVEEYKAGPLVREIEGYAKPGDGPATSLTGTAAATTDLKPLFGGEPAELWSDDFTPFEHNPKYFWDQRDTRWVLNPADLLTEQTADGVTIAAQAPQGYAGMTRILPYDPHYRFFQVKLDSIEGEGYRFSSIGFSNPSGAGGYRRCLNVNRPGLYTVDTWSIHDNYRTGEDKRAFLNLSVAGAHKQPDGSALPGPKFTWDFVRLVQRPSNGLVVTLGDGSPLPESVGEGDTLRFELYLEQPASDAVVEVQTGSNLSPMALNGDPYVQLHRLGDGRVWVGEVTLGKGTGKFTPKGYPAVFRAALTGGTLSETFAGSAVAFK